MSEETEVEDTEIIAQLSCYMHELIATGFEVRVSCVDHDYEPMLPRPGDVGYDIHALEDIYLPHNCRRKLNTGLIVECPEPLFVLIVPRSSMGTKYAKSVRIANTVAVIDPSFRGEDDIISITLEREDPKYEFKGRLALTAPTRHKSISIQANEALGAPRDHNTKCIKVSDEGYGIYDVFVKDDEPDLIYEKGDRYAQMLFIPAALPFPDYVEREALQSISRGGLGSTGKSSSSSS